MRALDNLPDLHLIWMARSAALLDMFEDLQRLRCCPSVQLFHTGEAVGLEQIQDSTKKVASGRPDLEYLLIEIGVDELCTQRTLVFVCGPPALVAACDEATRKVDCVTFHAETFEL